MLFIIQIQNGLINLSFIRYARLLLKMSQKSATYVVLLHKEALVDIFLPQKPEKVFDEWRQYYQMGGQKMCRQLKNWPSINAQSACSNTANGR